MARFLSAGKPQASRFLALRRMSRTMIASQDTLVLTMDYAGIDCAGIKGSRYLTCKVIVEEQLGGGLGPAPAGYTSARPTCGG